MLFQTIAFFLFLWSLHLAWGVYVIRGDREILVPSVPEFIKKVDTDEKIVTVRLIEGM